MMDDIVYWGGKRKTVATPTLTMPPCPLPSLPMMMCCSAEALPRPTHITATPHPITCPPTPTCLPDICGDTPFVPALTPALGLYLSLKKGKRKRDGEGVTVAAWRWQCRGRLHAATPCLAFAHGVAWRGISDMPSLHRVSSISMQACGSGWHGIYYNGLMTWQTGLRAWPASCCACT